MVPAVEAQADGIGRFLAEDPDEVTNIISVNVFDDASMWVADPATAHEKATGVKTEGARIDGNFGVAVKPFIYHSATK